MFHHSLFSFLNMTISVLAHSQMKKNNLQTTKLDHCLLRSNYKLHSSPDPPPLPNSHFLLRVVPLAARKDGHSVVAADYCKRGIIEYSTRYRIQQVSINFRFESVNISAGQSTFSVQATSVQLCVSQGSLHSSI